MRWPRFCAVVTPTFIDVVNEQQMLDLERQAFMRLARTGPTLARIEYTLDTGRPLRN